MHFYLKPHREIVESKFLFIVMRYDEAMYVTHMWTFTTVGEAETFMVKWIAENKPTCPQGYDQYTLYLHKMRINKPICELNP